MAEGLRIDVLLHRLCLTRSRNEAKTACDAGAVSLNGNKARAADTVLPGARVEVRWPARTLEMELLELPGKSVSRKAARDLYRVLREERTAERW
jgi:ribosome-associated heat shock protein Hsp15